jgi:8-oxo-dGTP pyrophosphatase MutT (NUDIX family)
MEHEHERRGAPSAPAARPGGAPFWVPAEPPFPGFDPQRAPNGQPWRRAAVLFLLYEREAGLYTVFMRRTPTVATHQGQIALPGGAHEPTDASLQQTALRETYEELGIPPEAVVILAELEPEYVAVSGFLVTPVIGRLVGPATFRPDPREVAEVIEVPVAALRDPACVREEERGTYIRRSPVYQYGPYEIWGATARILRRILARPEVGSASEAAG